MSRNKIMMAGFIGIVVGLLFGWLTYEGMHRTSDDKFCVSCHEMRPMVSSYYNDVHGGNGKSGIKVSCVSCHLPHDNIFNTIYTKAKIGIKEVGIHFFGNPQDIDWYAKREDKAKFVYDEACKSCHTNYQTNTSISKQGLKLHRHYNNLAKMDKAVNCVACHVEIGHDGLRSTLNYYNPQYEFYKGKLEKQKGKVEETLDAKLNKE